MNEPAFARANSVTTDGTITCCSQKGISQRRLLAGMALQAIVNGLYCNPDYKGWTVEGNVRAAIQYADELIKQTE